MPLKQTLRKSKLLFLHFIIALSLGSLKQTRLKNPETEVYTRNSFPILCLLLRKSSLPEVAMDGEQHVKKKLQKLSQVINDFFVLKE